MNRLVLLLLMLVVVLSPLPLGSNRDWSWSLCAVLVALTTLLWAVTRGWRPGEFSRIVHPAVALLFFTACIWIVIQTTGLVPAAWKHPVWQMGSEMLGKDLQGSITVSAGDGWIALMRLLSYALVFFLSFQLASDRSRARAMMGWVVTAGTIYAVFALAVFWGDYTPEFLFGSRELPHRVRGTMLNRNHFATWQGLTLLCALSLFFLKANREQVRPYTLPVDRATSVERYILAIWLPLTIILLMVAALLLTYSRGGFLSTLAGTAVLLILLDSRSTYRRFSARLVAVSAIAVCSLAFYLTSEVLLDRLENTDITTEGRLVVYENVRRGFEENPILGFGYGTFADSFRLYDRIEMPVHFDRAHNTWLENLFELGFPAALALFTAIGGLAITCLRGVRRRHRDWALPAVGVAASVLVGVHALFDFSLQIPAVAYLYACIMGIACAQAWSSRP